MTCWYGPVMWKLQAWSWKYETWQPCTVRASMASLATASESASEGKVPVACCWKWWEVGKGSLAGPLSSAPGA